MVVATKELPKNKWDDEDVEEEDVKESWEDEDTSEVTVFDYLNAEMIFSNCCLIF